MDKQKLEKAKNAYAELLKDKTALAEFLVEYIDPQHYTRDIIDLMLTTRAMNLGDALVKKVRRGIEVRTLVPGSVHLGSEITVSDVANYVLAGADVKVLFNLWELESGEIGTIDSIKAEMQAKLNDYFIARVYTALGNIWSAANTPNNYATGAAVTTALLEDAINQVNYRAGSTKAVIGTRQLLTPVTKFAAFWDNGAGTPVVWGSEERINEVHRTGWLGNYYGVPVVGLRQLWDNPIDNNPILPEDKILVIGENVGEFITYGPVRAKQWEDMNPTPPMWLLEFYQQYGMIIDNAQGLYVIEITG